MGRGKPTPGQKIELGGEERTLRYGNRAFYELESETGKTWTELRPRMRAGSSQAFTAAVWAGLLEDNPKITIDEVIDMIEVDRYEEIAEAVGRAVIIANGRDPDAIEDGEEEEGADSPTEAETASA